MQLRLTLYKKYFYEILNKQKLIEYRKLSKYYEKKFYKKKYETILFINGYGNNRPRFIIELEKVEKTNQYYELYLGKILRIENIKKENQKELF